MLMKFVWLHKLASLMNFYKGKILYYMCLIKCLLEFKVFYFYFYGYESYVKVFDHVDMQIMQLVI